MVYRIFTVLPALFAFAASPAWAGGAGSGGTSIDEPAALALLALGVVGLVVGRRVAKRRD